MMLITITLSLLKAKYIYDIESIKANNKMNKTLQSKTTSFKNIFNNSNSLSSKNLIISKTKSTYKKQTNRQRSNKNLALKNKYYNSNIVSPNNNNVLFPVIDKRNKYQAKDTSDNQSSLIIRKNNTNINKFKIYSPRFNNIISQISYPKSNRSIATKSNLSLFSNITDKSSKREEKNYNSNTNNKI